MAKNIENELPDQYRQIFEKLKQSVIMVRKAGLQKQSVDFITDFSALYLKGLAIWAQLKARPEWRPYWAQWQTVLAQSNIALYPEEKHTRNEMWQAIWVKLPKQIWQDRYFYLAAFLICLITGGIAFIMVRQDFEQAAMFMPTFLRSNHDLDAYILSDTAQQEMLVSGRTMDMATKTAFATFLMFNNIRVALLCFVTGFFYGIPTLILLIQTGLMLGTLPALFYGKHLVSLIAWMLPHGVPEVSAILLAGGAGLKIGMTMLSPQSQNWQRSLKATVQSLLGTFGICIICLFGQHWLNLL